MRTQLMKLAGLQALVATLGSLYFSEVKGWTPCELCWYQRIFMYPLVILILVGLIRRDANLVYYVLPMSVIGMVIAAYHYLLQMGVFTESTCGIDQVSCAVRTQAWFGFVTIPLLSFVAFVVIALCCWFTLRQARGK